jgi:hypothetical protein
MEFRKEEDEAKVYNCGGSRSFEFEMMACVTTDKRCM